MLYIILALQLVPVAPCSIESRLSKDEALVLHRVDGTVFDPRSIGRFPGILDRETVLGDMRHQLNFDFIAQEVWDAVKTNFQEIPIAELQMFTAYAKTVAAPGDFAAPTWAAQKSKAFAMAAFGHQRAAGNSSKGLDHLLPPGLSPEEHIGFALSLEHPFAAKIVSDPDTKFAARTIATWGRCIAGFRRRQCELLKLVVSAMEPLATTIRDNLHPGVARVAGHKSPALIAFLTAILQWPDKDQAARYVQGFHIVGEFPSTGVFRRLPNAAQPGKVTAEPEAEEPVAEPPSAEAGFFGEEAVKFLKGIVESGEPRDAEAIWRLTQEDVDKGFAVGPFSQSQLDSRFGPGRWRPLIRFLVTQASGKERAIDNAKKAGHNKWSQFFETIFTISADWVAEAAAELRAEVLTAVEGPEEANVEDDVELEIATEDLPDAYRGCPVDPQEYGSSVLAVWEPAKRQYTFFILMGLAYGLASAVLSFNRLPVLVVAALRRSFACIAAAYFDDMPVLDVSVGGGSALGALQQVLGAVGAPPAEEKGFGPAQYRAFLGTHARLAEAMRGACVTIEPKESTRGAVIEQIDTALSTDSLPSGAASKLRGTLGWLATNSLGRVGRLGAYRLKRRQYGHDPGSRVHDLLRDTLTFIKHVVAVIPPRRIVLTPNSQPPLIAYSDASYEPGSPPRLGWVVFEGLGAAEGGATDKAPGTAPTVACTLLIDQTCVDLWCPRKQQIFAAEALAPSSALVNDPEIYRGRDIIWFIDNEGACSTLVRGACAPEDIAGIAECTMMIAIRLGARIWYEWIDTAANPSDGLSRQGLQCPMFGHYARTASHPAWQFTEDHLHRLEQVVYDDFLALRVG